MLISAFEGFMETETSIHRDEHFTEKTTACPNQRLIMGAYVRFEGLTLLRHVGILLYIITAG